MDRDEVFGRIKTAYSILRSENYDGTADLLQDILEWLEDKQNSTMYEICESEFLVEGWLLRL